MRKLRDTYNELGIPRNEKKAVEAARSAEMQGAWIDGEKGICSSKGNKVGKYLIALVHVLNTRKRLRGRCRCWRGDWFIFSLFADP